MKKIIVLLVMVFSMQASFAYYTEYETSDIKTMYGKGYSMETLKMVDTARMVTRGDEKDYVPFFSTQLYSSSRPIKWYEVFKRYFDPAQDMHDFGVKEIQYSNHWFALAPSYYEKKNPNNRYQRLKNRDVKRLDVAGKVIEGSEGKEESVDFLKPGEIYDAGFFFEYLKSDDIDL